MIMEYETRKGEHHSKKVVEQGYDFADWTLNKIIVRTVKVQFGEPLVDLFATELNKKAEYYFKKDQIGESLETNCLGVDAYKYHWNMFKGVLCWVNPPFEEIMNAVDKAITDDLGEFILITPYYNRRVTYLAGGCETSFDYTYKGHLYSGF
jgi:hypothetical protein